MAEVKRLEDELRGMTLELERSGAEAKALRHSNSSMEKAIKSLTEEAGKLKERLEIAENNVEAKILELKKAHESRRAALSAQAAAEATIRRLQAAKKDQIAPAVEASIASLEAELKLAQKEISRLQEDGKAQDRLLRAKEAALLESEQTVASASARAQQVDEYMNRNTELCRQLEAAQEENKTLDKLHKQKIEEVKKLSVKIDGLTEALAAAGIADSVVKDYQRQLQEQQAHQRLLQEELARAKVAASRVAMAVANEWKDDNDKVIPMKQWLEEKRIMQGEIDKLKEKVAMAEKATKYEAVMKEKAQQKLKVIEDSLKSVGTPKSQRTVRSPLVRSASRSEAESASTPGMMEFKGSRQLLAGSPPAPPCTVEGDPAGMQDSGWGSGSVTLAEDVVSGVLYDLLQREVVILRRVSREREQELKDKEGAIQALTRKVDLLTKAMDSESKKYRRDIGSLEREVSSLKLELQNRGKRFSAKGSSPMTGREAKA